MKLTVVLRAQLGLEVPCNDDLPALALCHVLVIIVAKRVIVQVLISLPIASSNLDRPVLWFRGCLRSR